MSNEKVIIDIDKSGGVQVSADGVKGDSCTLLTRDSANALGTVTSDKPTDEMYETPETYSQEQYA